MSKKTMYPRRDFLRALALGIPSVRLLAGSKGIAANILDEYSAQALFVEASSLEERAADERLTFQTRSVWIPRINVDADVAIVYGLDSSLPGMVESWRNHGYKVALMTAVAWGEYQDYMYGHFDGVSHEDEFQTERDGRRIDHGGDVYYMVPSESYVHYLTVGIKRALDLGVEAVYMEEPEFWVSGGYSASFKREWKAHYGDDWVPPHSSVDAQYRSSKLKYYLYRRALSTIFTFVHDYGNKVGRKIPCYVPTHSLINYSHWKIVSPESSLLKVDCDGYVAQVWTGTARTPNVYEGTMATRTFETAFLEYGVMQNLARASGRRVWYLNDPIEDDPHHSWKDYRANWECTLTASLMQPDVWWFEIMPWPERIFERKYPRPAVKGLVSGGTVPLQGQRLHHAHPEEEQNVDTIEPQFMPHPYEKELQAVIRALGDMKQPAEKTRWEVAGTEGVGLLVSDTMMFQRGDPNPSDPNLGSFYGLALPLLKHGVPIEPVQIENAATAEFLARYRLLLLTYEGQKPPAPEFHHSLAEWVRAGGALVIVDDDNDPYNSVHEWWNTAPLAFVSPRQHLFQALGVAPDATGLHQVEKGAVLREALSPAALGYKADGAQQVRDLARKAAEAVKLPWKESNALVLRRGPYLVTAGLNESVPGAAPVTMRGSFVNLFEGELPVASEVMFSPGLRALLVDLKSFPPSRPRVVAASCRVRNEQARKNSLKFLASGIDQTEAVVRAIVPRAPKSVTVAGKLLSSDAYDASDGTVRIRFANSVEGVAVEIHC